LLVSAVSALLRHPSAHTRPMLFASSGSALRMMMRPIQIDHRRETAA
jgi:hypothetical protein